MNEHLSVTQILAYLDNIDNIVIRNHIQECTMCKNKFDEVQKFSQFFKTAYTGISRAECPSSETMLAYHTKTLPERDRDAVENHFKECAFCSAEKIMAKYELPEHTKYLKPDEDFLKQLNNKISENIVTETINSTKPHPASKENLSAKLVEENNTIFFIIDNKKIEVSGIDIKSITQILAHQYVLENAPEREGEFNAAFNLCFHESPDLITEENAYAISANAYRFAGDTPQQDSILQMVGKIKLILKALIAITEKEGNKNNRREEILLELQKKGFSTAFKLDAFVYRKLGLINE